MKSRAINIICLMSVALSTSLYAQDKPSLGVLEFQNTTAASWWGGGIGWELSGMLTNELANTKAFSLVERNKLEAVIQEQNLAASGRVADKGAEIGKLIGAQYLVDATVSAFEHNVQNTGGGISFGGLSIGGKKDEAYMAVDLRVIDSSTGEIAYVRTVEARSGGLGLSLGAYKGGFGGNLANESKTPAGKAIRAVIVEISDYLECAMVDQDRCMEEYDAKEEKRKESLKGGISLD
jgi:curli biogenesis system outer membrane secretion channel CsgG